MAHLPFTRPTDFLRERDFGRKIEASFDFIRAHFRPLGACLFYIVLPLMLVQGIAGGLLTARMGGFITTLQASRIGGRASQSESLRRVSEMLNSPEYWILILGGLFSFTLLILTVYGYVVLRLEKADPNEPVTVREVWAVVRRRFVGTILSFFGLGLVVMVGGFLGTMVMGLLGLMMSRSPAMVIVLVFGLYALIIYVSVVFSLFFIIQLRERTGFFASIARCFSLVWGKWWSTFGLIMVMALLSLMLILVLFSLTSLISSPFAAATETPTVAARLLAVVAACLNSVLALAIYPLMLLALAFQYFNLVERKEGHGLHALVDAIGTRPEPLAPRSFRPDDEGEY